MAGGQGVRAPGFVNSGPQGLERYSGVPGSANLTSREAAVGYWRTAREPDRQGGVGYSVRASAWRKAHSTGLLLRLPVALPEKSRRIRRRFPHRADSNGLHIEPILQSSCGA